MERYIVVSPHKPEDCDDALKQILYTGFLTHFDWGCADGEHTGWAIIEAENAKEAMLVVPPKQRQAARVVRLVKFSFEEVEKMH